jgi:hypothetical protein
VSTPKNEDFYVYVLIDPTNGDNPFYVGKGIGDRAADHLSQNPEDPREKAQMIEKIRSLGAEPYVRRVMWNLDENTAFAVETALINTLPYLVNIIQGQNLSSVRLKRDFPDWVGTYPGVDISMSNGKIDFLDSEDEETCYFLSKKDAYNAAGSGHKRVQGSYHIHTQCGIRMWTGNLLDRDWVNQYDPHSGDYFIGLKEVMERHKTWENIIIESGKLTLNKVTKDNKFLCFTKGLSPNNYVKFLGVYEDDWEESRRQDRIVRKRLRTSWKIP